MRMAVLSTALLAMAATGGHAGERNAFAFTGRMMDDDMGHSLNVVGADYDDSYITGFGYQDFAHRAWITSLGYELGAAIRYGDGSTYEAWGGAVARLDDFRILDNLFVAPSVVFGLSYVSAAHPGREQEQQEARDGDAKLLFYLSPELDFRTSVDARWSVFYRLQHRSGAWETLGGMEGGVNANVVGLRMRF